MSRQAPVWFRHFERKTRAVNRIFAAIASALALVIVVLVLVAVIARLFGSHILWPYDITQFAMVYLVFLAMAPAMETGHHVVVELFDALLPPSVRRYVQYVAAIMVIIFGTVLFYQLYRMTSRAFADDRLAVAAIAVQLKWVYLIGPIGILQFILTAFADLGRAHWRMTGAARTHPGH
jgi:TRAP-type C4-dicarboxylate transport system permease small subunit